MISHDENSLVSNEIFVLNVLFFICKNLKYINMDFIMGEITLQLFIYTYNNVIVYSNSWFLNNCVQQLYIFIMFCLGTYVLLVFSLQTSQVKTHRA